MAEDNYYPDPEEAPMGHGPPPGRGPDQEEEAGDQSALLPKSIFGAADPKVGDTITVKIVHVYEDELEVEPVSESTETKPSTTPPSADQEIDMMATE